MAKRSEMQWMRVAMYTPMYCGVGEAPMDAYFIADNNPMRDGDGWDSEGNTSGSYTVWPNFAAFKRQYINARFDDDGRIDKG